LVWEENTILENIFMIYTQALLYRQKSHILAYTGGNASRKAFKISRANSNTHVLEKISFLGLVWEENKILENIFMAYTPALYIFRNPTSWHISDEILVQKL